VTNIEKLEGLRAVIDRAVEPETHYVMLVLRKDGDGHVVDVIAQGEPETIDAMLEHAPDLRDHVVEDQDVTPYKASA